MVLPVEVLAENLRERLGLTGAEIRNLSQVAYGAARRTFLFDLETTDASGRRAREELVLRLDPEDPDGSLVPSDMKGEFDWYDVAFRAAGVPAPEPLVLELDPALLGAPFLVMRRLPGHADTATMLSAGFDDVREAVATDAMSVLGRIARIDVDVARDRTGVGGPAGTSDAWRAAIDYWDALLLEHELGPMPVTRSAVDLLRDRPPAPSERLVVVHGDYRLGNYLYQRSGVVGILDWEMAHIGDPHEDLAWALNETWARTDPSRVWGFLPRERALDAWQRSSGMTVDENSLAWWTLFSNVKATALWIKGASSVVHGRSDIIRYLTNHWSTTVRQEEQTMRAMADLQTYPTTVR